MDETVSVGNKRMDVVGSSNKKSRKVRKAKTSKKKMILVLKGQEKKNTPHVTLPGYTWVTGEVGIYSSIFQNTKSITDLKDRVNLTYINNLDWVITDHCLPSEQVFLSVRQVEIGRAHV